MSEKFFGKSYLYNDKTIGVVQGLGSNFIIAYYSKSGGKHRVRNYKAFSTYSSAEEAQVALDKYAKINSLMEAN